MSNDYHEVSPFKNPVKIKRVMVAKKIMILESFFFSKKIEKSTLKFVIIERKSVIFDSKSKWTIKQGNLILYFVIAWIASYHDISALYWMKQKEFIRVHKSNECIFSQIRAPSAHAYCPSLCVNNDAEIIVIEICYAILFNSKHSKCWNRRRVPLRVWPWLLIKMTKGFVSLGHIWSIIEPSIGWYRLKQTIFGLI